MARLWWFQFGESAPRRRAKRRSSELTRRSARVFPDGVSTIQKLNFRFTEVSTIVHVHDLDSPGIGKYMSHMKPEPNPKRGGRCKQQIGSAWLRA